MIKNFPKPRQIALPIVYAILFFLALEFSKIILNILFILILFLIPPFLFIFTLWVVACIIYNQWDKEYFFSGFEMLDEAGLLVFGGVPFFLTGVLSVAHILNVYDTITEPMFRITEYLRLVPPYLAQAADFLSNLFF